MSYDEDREDDIINELAFDISRRRAEGILINNRHLNFDKGFYA
jgi:hypothetical protein